MEKLKPCPFCGGRALLVEHFEYENCKSNTGQSIQKPKPIYYVRCNSGCDCLVLVKTKPELTEKESIKSWNTRA